MIGKEVVLPGGETLTIVASAGDAGCRDDLPKAQDEIRILSTSWFKKKYACGHRGPRRFELSVYGDVVRPGGLNNNCPDCCVEEIRNTVIRCASCELPIFPGDGVVLYHPITKGLNLAIANFVDPDAVVGCMRWDCCTHPELFSGHWTSKGFKQFSFEDHE